MPEKDTEKKQLPLRISKTLYNDLVRWAEDDFRSLNGQIEFLLTECVHRRRGIRREKDPVPPSFGKADDARPGEDEEDPITG